MRSRSRTHLCVHDREHNSFDTTNTTSCSQSRTDGMCSQPRTRRCIHHFERIVFAVVNAKMRSLSRTHVYVRVHKHKIYVSVNVLIKSPVVFPLMMSPVLHGNTLCSTSHVKIFSHLVMDVSSQGVHFQLGASNLTPGSLSGKRHKIWNPQLTAQHRHHTSVVDRMRITSLARTGSREPINAPNNVAPRHTTSVPSGCTSGSTKRH